MRIKNLIIHEVIKEIAKESSLNKSATSIDIDETAKEFVDQIRQVYNKRTGRYNGIFDSDKDNYPFQKKLREYKEGHKSFVEMTHLSMNIFKKEIDKENLATGGYIIYCEYEQAGGNYMMILMLHDKKSYVIDNNLQLKDSFQLNLDELSMAARVNIEQWNKSEDSYLTFVRGKKRQEVSKYFFEFIGCTSNTSSSKSTRALIDVLIDHFNEKKYSVNERNRIKNIVFEYCDNARKNNKHVVIRDLAEYTFSTEDEIEEFYKKSTEDKYKLDAIIEINRSKLRTLRVYKTSWKDIGLSFPNGTPLVDVDEESKSVILKDVPLKKLEEIRKFTYQK